MDLIKILNKHIPTKKKIFSLFHKKQSQDISSFFLQTIKRVKKETKDNSILNALCIELYDLVSYYIMFDKIKVTKKFLRLLEELALPMHCIGQQKWDETLKKVIKLKL